MNFVPFAETHAATVAGWPTSAREVVMWCGEHAFPVPEQTVVDWHREVDVRAHLLVDGQAPVAYGELWFDADEDEIELARIIVAPAARRRGVGRELVKSLLVEALGAGYGDIFMRVHPDNDAALRCYLGAGFTPVAPALAEAWNEPQPIAYTWLRHDGASL